MTKASHTTSYQIIDRSQLTDYPHDLVVSFCVDCACAVVSQSLPAAPTPPVYMPEKYFGLAPELRLEAVDAGHWAVFNPTGNHGIVVVDDDAARLLNRFERPVTPQEVLNDLDCNEEAQQAVGRLQALDLLQSSDIKLPRQEWQNRPQLLTAWLHITNACNLGCVYCYVDKNHEHMSVDMGKTAVNAIVRSALAGGYPAIRLKYAGGEASLQLETVFMVHDYAVEQCQAAGLGLQAVLLTNGVTLGDLMVLGLKEREIEVMVSLDSLDGELGGNRPFLGGQSSSKRTLQGIHRLLIQDISPHITITVTDHNSPGIAKVVRYCLAHELKFSLNFYRDNAVAAMGADVQFTDDRIIAGMEAAFQAIEENLPPWSIVGAILDRGQLVEPHEQACGAARDYIAIDHYGRVAKCHMEFEQPVGDISATNLLPMIQSSPIGVQNPSSQEKEGCRDCEWRFYCAGGCPLVTHWATGRYDIKSPNCGIYKAIFPIAVRLEGLRLLKYGQALLV
ncbi:radical SAM protein [Candidatus Leptofilum sp.]|uniref:radical SAM protein n=1 Tax=Candidatus Leptofilum sp. TaxID=3241576 RepID=UPI003B59D186